MILAALLDQCLDPKCNHFLYTDFILGIDSETNSDLQNPFFLSDEVDLLNVSFDGPNAPDRISAKSGIEELKRIAPLRRYSTLKPCLNAYVYDYSNKFLTLLMQTLLETQGGNLWRLMLSCQN